MKRKFIIAGAASVILVAAGSGAFFYGNSVGANAQDGGGEQAQNGPPPAPVTVAKAELRTLAPQSETPGSVVSTRDSLVAAATSGVIEWVAEVGAEVEEGDVVARIDPADARLSRDNSAADVKRLRARANYLDSLYKRYVGLGEDAGESEATLDEMRSNRDEALQSVAQAEVALQRAQINLARTEVVAPFAGRVVSQESQVGEFANPGVGLVRLVDTRRLEVTARAPAGLARNIDAGATIKVSNGADNMDAIVRAVVPVGDALSRMLELRMELPDTNWYIGSAVRVSLPNGAPRAVTAVPRDALVLRANRISVYVIDEENNAKRYDVELGTAEGNFIEVIGDVEPGDSVVIRGGERLRDGQSVTISEIQTSNSV
ncbi:MAG: efflux RND transporter periplasmic adaptor subunit [Marinicaulis sp.]|nr:efflux RND transporter periplasmic adaptor subunit [Marinicaulis sp.]NNL89829.1 efflux RND transporter periplasmic adaptor subunit [Marinicaulis sp.]